MVCKQFSFSKMRYSFIANCISCIVISLLSFCDAIIAARFRTLSIFAAEKPANFSERFFSEHSDESVLFLVYIFISAIRACESG